MSDLPDLLKIGDFADSAGTNLRTLRYYEELGLLKPALRSEGGFRYYRPTDVHRVRMIQDLQELGLQLEAIGELLDTRNLDAVDGETPREAMVRRIRTALEGHRALIDERISLLHDQHRRIDAATRKLENCTPCEHTPGEQNNFCEPCVRTGLDLPAFLSALF